MGELKAEDRYAAYKELTEEPPIRFFDYIAEFGSAASSPQPHIPEPAPQGTDPDGAFYSVRLDPQYQTDEFREAMRARGIEGPPISFR